MTLDLASTVLPLVSVLAETSSDEGDGRALGLLFLLSGPLFYSMMYLRYRNSDKRHHHESETEAKAEGMRAVDERIGSVKGVSNSSLAGSNSNRVRGARRGLG